MKFHSLNFRIWSKCTISLISNFDNASICSKLLSVICSKLLFMICSKLLSVICSKLLFMICRKYC